MPTYELEERRRLLREANPVRAAIERMAAAAARDSMVGENLEALKGPQKEELFQERMRTYRTTAAIMLTALMMGGPDGT